MKKLFTLCASLFVGFATMNAQTFAFVDASGNVINSGTTLTMDGELEVNSLTGDVQLPLESVSIKNVSGAEASCDLVFTMVDLPGGKFNACCAGVCKGAAYNTGDVVSYIHGVDNQNNTIQPNATLSLAPTEWTTAEKGGTLLFEDEFGPCYGLPVVDYGTQGTCVVKISVSVAGASTPDSEITVNFVNDNGAGVSSVVADKENPVVGYYTIGGAQINAPQKGINIVKYADGTTKKVILK